jgi:exopolyphosphatase/guanosine-5'-triphosphate,3'-diphosphate pyrophosphatase
MRIASIDIGTNTVLLLIAEVDIQYKIINPLFNDYQMPRLGRGLMPGQPIANENLEALMIVLKSFHQSILKYNCEEVIVTGTNALRIASNAGFVKSKLKSDFNFELDIISGEKEAEFAFLGALSESSGSKESMVIDIGGGSTEIIYGNNEQIKYKKSFQVGSVSATEKYLTQNPVIPVQFKLLDQELKNIFAELKGRFKPEKVIAVAGTATTLSCMHNDLKEFDESIVSGSILTVNDLQGLIEKMKKLTPEQILNSFGKVMKGREDIILAGALILYTILLMIGTNEVSVSSRGIRYGAIVNFMRKIRS